MTLKEGLPHPINIANFSWKAISLRLVAQSGKEITFFFDQNQVASKQETSTVTEIIVTVSGISSHSNYADVETCAVAVIPPEIQLNIILMCDIF